MSKIDKLAGCHKISNLVYSKLIEDDTLLEPKRIKWERHLNVNISSEEFKKHFSNVHCVTVATKYRDFQFRLLHNAIITNKILCLWGKKTNDLCTFCKNATEDMLHLFCYCSKVVVIWDALKQYISSTASIVVHNGCVWNPYSILMNTVQNRKSHVINLLVIIAKQYIYRQRCLNSVLLVNQLICEIEHVYSIEYGIAKSKNRLLKHYTKWLPIKPELQELIDEIQDQLESLQINNDIVQ